MTYQNQNPPPPKKKKKKKKTDFYNIVENGVGECKKKKKCYLPMFLKQFLLRVLKPQIMDKSLSLSNSLLVVVIAILCWQGLGKM